MRLIKLFIKKLLSFTAWLFLLPLLIIYRIQSYFTKSERFFSDIAQLVSLAPGTMGDYIRREFYKFSLDRCSDTCCISFGTIISHPETRIGENVYVGLYCMIGTVTIEDDVLIGSNVDIIDGGRQHNFDSIDIPIRQQKRSVERIVLGKNSWIGNSSVVMANIGQGSVVGAGSVVGKKY